MALDPLVGELERLRALNGIKWSKHGNEVLNAWVADMDLRPAPMAIDAVRSMADLGDFGYERAHRERIGHVFADWQQDAHGWAPDAERVRLFSNVLHAIDNLIWHTTEPGDGIVLFTPIYPPFIKAATAAGRRLVESPLDPDDWSLDVDALSAAIDDRTRIILLCNPHNPTGHVHSAAELAAIADVARAHDLTIISDEVWGDLLHPGATHVPMATICPERTVTVSSASKSFNLAGLRCAVAHVGDERVERALDALPPFILGGVSTLGLAATVACWEDGRSWLNDTKRHLTGQRDHLVRRIATDCPMVGLTLPDATYLAWLDFRWTDLGPDPAARLLADAGVALSSGLDFGPRGEGFARLNTATSRPVLDAIVDRIAALVEDGGVENGASGGVVQ